MNVAKRIAEIEGENILLMEDGTVRYRSKAAIDGDGTGPSHGDRYYQSDTSLHVDGKPLNADLDQYIAVPPAIIAGVGPIVLGSKVELFNRNNGKSCDAVVGDIGPHAKLGEISIAAAKSLGIPASPTTGGEDRHVIDYVIHPGVAAVVNGKQYPLQPSKAH